MSEQVGPTSLAWHQLFDKYNIIQRVREDGAFEITANEIIEFREPRLMAKFDHSKNLPEIFRKNKLSILPRTRGRYVISNFQTYHDLEPHSASLIKVQFPEHLQSIDYRNISSEAIALNCAFATGIIQDFLRDEELIPTVSGRMSSGVFRFQIRNTMTNAPIPVDVENSQVEIDGGYEGIASLGIIEAKMDLSDDFIVRQLYYPFRLMKNRMTKPVRPVFMFYSNGIFRLYEYAFENPIDYNSLVLVNQKNYTIEDAEMSRQDIMDALYRNEVVEEPKIPFPQANKFERVINLCELLQQRDLSHDEITANYDFTARQTDYYTNAGRYLELIESGWDEEQKMYYLSAKGKQMLDMNYQQRQLYLCTKIMEHQAFREVVTLYLERGEMPSTEEIVSIMKRSNLFGIDEDSTSGRRAGTIRGWANWIVELVQKSD